MVKEMGRESGNLVKDKIKTFMKVNMSMTKSMEQEGINGLMVQYMKVTLKTI